MISQISGTIVSKNKDTVTVMVGGFGLEVYVNSRLMPDLFEGQKVRLYTKVIAKEDGWYLYGFQNREEKALFDLLLTVKGIGPKLALGVLSSVSVQEFYKAVVSSDEKALAGLPGIGRKTAGRIILELRDRIGLSSERGKEKIFPPSRIFDEASEALCALGYTRQEAETALKEVLNGVKSHDLETLLREALRRLARI